jgi:hypothetical protein
MSVRKARVVGASNGSPAWSIPSLREPRYSQSLERGLAILGCFTPKRPVLGIADIADERVPRTQKEGRCRTSRRMWCCMRDGGARRTLVWWSSAVALQEEAANHPELLRSRAMVVSVVGKGALRACQVWITKASVSEPLMMCRKRYVNDIKTRAGSLSWDESGGCLLTGQVVSGIKVARAWSGLSCGTWEPVALRSRAASGAGLACGCAWKGELQAVGPVRGRVPMWGTGADCPVVAVMPGNAGGAKGTGRPGLFDGQPLSAGGAG